MAEKRVDDMGNMDFTETTADGFVVVPPGRYKADSSAWQRRVKDNGNIVHDIDFTVTEGEFKGERLRYFQTIVPDDQSSIRRFRRILDILGLVTEADRNEEGELKAKFDYGEETDWGALPVQSIAVNDVEKSIIGIPVILEVSNRASQNDPRQKVHWVDRVQFDSSLGEEDDTDLDELPF